MKNTTLLSLSATVIAVTVGLYFQFFTKEIDSPIEQIAEQVLAEKGIDVDFSKDKKIVN